MIEILKDVHVLKIGQTVGASEAALLAKMNLKPFEYGMEILKVYDDGSILDKKVVEFEPSVLIEKFGKGVMNLTALSMETGYITPMAVPHMIVNAFKNLAGIAMETDYKLEALEAAKNAGPVVASNAGE
jgi:large subunit ribosomal protein LP0